jgi:threonine dehydrogenase-like Zn-dependent dehydrogenase
MKAIAVHPKVPNSMHVRDVPEPSLDSVPGGRGALVEVLRVGVDGTDRDILEGLYGAPPPGDDYLIAGHENLGRVLDVGPNAGDRIRPGMLVVTTVRRPGKSIYDAIGMQDMTTDAVYYERGINLLHGYMSERYVDAVDFMVPLPDTLAETGCLLEPITVAEKGIRQAVEIQRRLRVWSPRRACVLGAGSIGLIATLLLRLRGVEVIVYSRRPGPYLNSTLAEELGAVYVSSSATPLDQAAMEHGPFDLMIEATGYGPMVFEAAASLGTDGVLVAASVTGGNTTATIPADRINQGFVLGNKVLVGTVNAALEDFEQGVADMIAAEAFHPGWLGKLLTTRVAGFDAYEELADHLLNDKAAIKTFVELKAPR